MPSCSICSSDPRKEKVSLFKIPMNDWIRQRWNKACNRTFTNSDRMCNKHFLKTDYINQPGACKVARLLPCAVPSVFFEKENPNVSRSFLHILKPSGLNMKENLSRNKNKLETFIEKNLMDRFGFPTVDPIGEEQTITLVDPDDDDERTLSADELEVSLSADELEVSLEELGLNNGVKFSTEAIIIFVCSCQFDDHHTRKCGHILYNIDEDIFTLNCFFCSTICLDLFTFSEHVKRQHDNLRKQKIEIPIDAVSDFKSIDNSIPQYKNIYIETADNEQGSNLMSYLKIEPTEITHYSNFDSDLNVAIKENDEIPSTSSLNSSDDEDNTTENNKQTENLGIELNNRALISNFIHLLKRKPFIFWNKEQQFKKRKVALKCISDALGKKFPHLKFTYENVSALMYAMRAAYQSELKQIKVTKERGIDYVPHLWFFNKLKSFDCDYGATAVQKKIESLKGIAAQLPLNIYHGDSTDNEIITLQIIGHYEKQPHLWNINHANYGDKFSDESCLQKFYTFISSNYPYYVQITLKEFETALEQMHRWYAAEESIRLSMENLNEPFNSNYPRIYKALEFLRGHLPPFRCDICAKVLQRDSSFVLHKKRCNAVKECKHCHKLFTTFKNLQGHMKVHLNERSYLCTFCGNKYSTKASLRYHVGRRHNESTFNCDECQRTYHSHNSLRIHKKSHLGIKDYVCDLCGKAFTSSKYLYTHRSNHSAEKKRKRCKNCGKTFQAVFFNTHKEICIVLSNTKTTRLCTKKNKAAALKPAKKESGKLKNKKNSI